ncbi:hypothetical protein, partial [Pectobacterium versatile]|uniref:hypothetical protein n=1 Tax=Pectobacterium versatile TaxID=2488639 RepID=UPI003018BFE7
AVERVIGDVLVFKEDGDGVGCTSDLVFKALMDECILREVRVGGVEVDHDLLAFTVRQDWQRHDRALWLGG